MLAEVDEGAVFIDVGTCNANRALTRRGGEAEILAVAAGFGKGFYPGGIGAGEEFI